MRYVQCSGILPMKRDKAQNSKTREMEGIHQRQHHIPKVPNRYTPDMLKANVNFNKTMIVKYKPNVSKMLVLPTAKNNRK